MMSKANFGKIAFIGSLHFRLSKCYKIVKSENSEVRKFCIGTVLFAAVLDDLTRFYSNNMFCMIILEGQVWLVHLKC